MTTVKTFLIPKMTNLSCEIDVLFETESALPITMPSEFFNFDPVTFKFTVNADSTNV